MPVTKNPSLISCLRTTLKINSQLPPTIIVTMYMGRKYNSAMKHAVQNSGDIESVEVVVEIPGLGIADAHKSITAILPAIHLRVR